MTKMIDAKDLGQRELNEKIKSEAKSENSEIKIKNVDGQRYIGIGLKKGKIIIEGVAGNDLGMFFEGASIFVEGNAEDGVGNTMDSG
ncbi:hypothetical protein KY311_02570, partial [Candidatus Woesearchaeota archaeon]|nr:hypothetical protein [Candidatus Woesearchaeota archaeon]